MIPELGNFALILALLLALIQGTLPIIGAARGIPSWMALARPVVQGQFVFVAIAFFCLAYSFVTSDFSVINVVQNSNSKLPLEYRFAATWGSHEGSLLLWTMMLATWVGLKKNTRLLWKAFKTSMEATPSAVTLEAMIASFL